MTAHLRARDFFVDVTGARRTRAAGRLAVPLEPGPRAARCRHPHSAPTPALLAEIAGRLADGRRLVGARAIRASRWPASASSTSRGPSPDRSPPGCSPDLGADVIKIESEHRLDPIRHIGPQPTDRRLARHQRRVQRLRGRQAGRHDQRRHRRGPGSRAAADPHRRRRHRQLHARPPRPVGLRPRPRSRRCGPA